MTDQAYSNRKSWLSTVKGLTLTDLYIILTLPVLFHVSLSGPSLEFADKDAFFQSLGNTDSNIRNQIATFVLLGFGVYQFYNCKMSLWRVLSIAAPFIPFLLWALLSITWSEYPGISFRRSARVVIEMTGIILLAMSYATNPERFVRIFFSVCLVIIAIDLIILPLSSLSWSSIGYLGLHYHKQFAGRFILVSMPFFIIAVLHPRFQSMRRMGLAGLAICFVLLPLTQAKTIWVTLPTALLVSAVIICLFRDNTQKPVIALACFGLCGLIGISMAFGLDLDTLLERVFGDSTLTGRDQIWRFAFSKFYGNEALGVGFGALWQTGTEVVDRLRDGYKIYAVNEAHNGYIDILVQTGISGTVLLGLALVWMFLRLVRDASTLAKTDNYLPFIALVLFIGMLVVNLTDSTIFQALTSLWAEPVAFYALCRAVALRQRDASSAPAPISNGAIVHTGNA